MNLLDETFNFKLSQEQYISTKHEDDKIITFEKGDLLFVFNFHPTKSFENYTIGTKWGTKHKIILDSDEERFMGKGRLKYGHENFFPIIHKKFQIKYAIIIKFYIILNHISFPWYFLT